MQTTVNIDKSGRIVIPKELREELGFVPDQPILMEEIEGGVVLRSAATGKMVERGGIWVYETGHPSNVDIVELIRQDREARGDHVAGWKPSHD